MRTSLLSSSLLACSVLLLVLNPTIAESPTGGQLARGLQEFSTVSVENSCFRWNHPRYGQDARKNMFLCAYQRALEGEGVKDASLLRLLLAQKIVEDGMFDARRVSKGGCMIGHFQYNRCVHGEPEESFYSDPAQIDWMVQRITGFRKFFGDRKPACILFAHFLPGTAKKMNDNAWCAEQEYYKKIKTQALSLDNM